MNTYPALALALEKLVDNRGCTPLPESVDAAVTEVVHLFGDKEAGEDTLAKEHALFAKALKAIAAGHVDGADGVKLASIVLLVEKFGN